MRTGYDNHNCPNKPLIGNGLESEWRHARKQWTSEFEDFEKKSVGKLTMGHVGTQLGCLPQWQTIEIEFRPRCWEVGGPTMMLRSWVKTIMLRSLSPARQFGFWGWTREDEVEFLPLGHRVGFRPFKDVVSIEWLQKSFKNFVSLIVSKKVQKLINVCTWTTESPVYLHCGYITCRGAKPSQRASWILLSTIWCVCVCVCVFKNCGWPILNEYENGKHHLIPA